MSEVDVNVDTVAHTRGAAWFLAALRDRRPVSGTEVQEHFTDGFVAAVTAAGLADGVTHMAVGLQVVEPLTVEPGPVLRIPLSPTGAFAPFRVRVGVEGEQLNFLDFGPMEIEGVEIGATSPATLTSHVVAAVRQLFHASYEDGDDDYLDAQLATLATIATAWDGDVLAGFALSDARVADFPQLPGQVVRTAGLSCTAASHRRLGIGSRLESIAMTGGDAPAAEHTLLTSRFAHPAGYHYLRHRPDIVPRPAYAPTSWQTEIAVATATLLGAPGFDPDTFVFHGTGRPVGRPRIDVEVPDDERQLFAAVDRSRGDTLLAVWWTTPPPGWADRNGPNGRG